MGRIRNTERKKVPGNRYLPGTNRFVEYSTKMPTAESSSTASHIQDCWEISTGAMNTVTARVMPSTAMRVTMAGTESDRVRSEEHTSELQSRGHLVCRLLLEKKKSEGPEREERRAQRKR